MSRTRNGGRGAPPIGKAEALQILESALSYCMQAGFDVRVGNVGGGKLAVTIAGAEIVRDGATARLAVLTPACIAQQESRP